jgi:hypothetical protein
MVSEPDMPLRLMPPLLPLSPVDVMESNVAFSVVG